MHTWRDTERGGADGLPLPPDSTAGEVAGIAAPADRGGASGERRGHGDALVYVHPREVVAPLETTYDILTASTGGAGRRRQAVAGLW
jgi:hypothetical protein